MKKFYNRIARMATALNCEYKEIPYGIMVYVNDTEPNPDKYFLLRSHVSRLKSAHIEGNYHAESIRVYHQDDYTVMKESENKITKLVDFFYLELRRNGGNQKAAQKAQKAYAESINATSEYNKIYA